MYKLLITTAASVENNHHLWLVHIYSVAQITDRGRGGGAFNYEQLLPHLITAIHNNAFCHNGNPVQNNPNQILVFCTLRGPTALWGLTYATATTQGFAAFEDTDPKCVLVEVPVVTKPVCKTDPCSRHSTTIQTY